MGFILLMEDGFYIDLVGKIELRRGFEILVYVVGLYESMDEVLDNIDELKEEVIEIGWFIFDKKE